MAGIFSTLINWGISNALQKQQEEANERAAQNADKRTRALYYDLYSPQAQVENLKEAGLSVGLMYGKGGGGGGGASGAQAAPAQPSMVTPLDLANTQLVMAQVKKTNAETKNIEESTKQTTASTEKTNQEIINLLTQNKLDVAKLRYQELINGITEYDLKFKGETYQTDVEIRKVELAKLVEDYRASIANANSAEIRADIENSTAAARVKQELQKVILNDLEIANKKLNLNLTQAQIEKVNQEVIEKRLTNAWIDIKNEEDIRKLQHDIQMDLYELDIKDREVNYQMAKGILDTLISVVKPF